MRATGDLLEGLIFLEIIRCNTEHLSPDARGGEGSAPQDFVADRLRRPVRITAVARRFGLPIETVRRHLRVLLDRGLCVRTPTGFIVPAEVLARPVLARVMAENVVNLHRMFDALSQLGVLAVWDRAEPPA
jgi:hypothetical protein